MISAVLSFAGVYQPMLPRTNLFCYWCSVYTMPATIQCQWGHGCLQVDWLHGDEERASLQTPHRLTCSQSPSYEWIPSLTFSVFFLVGPAQCVCAHSSQVCHKLSPGTPWFLASSLQGSSETLPAWLLPLLEFLFMLPLRCAWVCWSSNKTLALHVVLPSGTAASFSPVGFQPEVSTSVHKILIVKST